MNKIPIVITDRERFEEIGLGLTEIASKQTAALSDVEALALENVNKELSKLLEYNILETAKLLTEPGSRLVNSIIEALADGRINLGDVPQGAKLIGAVSEIAELIKPSIDELKDLSWDEAELIIIIILREVRKIWSSGA